ncbi:MAG TPA: hypothetical protein VJB37_03230 [Patescibacteria group bacterium]|nr:hypothetical protein [Patescibacteria group bacterium]
MDTKPWRGPELPFRQKKDAATPESSKPEDDSLPPNEAAEEKKETRQDKINRLSALFARRENNGSVTVSTRSLDFGNPDKVGESYYVPPADFYRIKSITSLEGEGEDNETGPVLVELHDGTKLFSESFPGFQSKVYILTTDLSPEEIRQQYWGSH